MFGLPPIFTRIAIAKALGLLYGLLWLIWTPETLPHATMFAWGACFWAVTLGGIVGAVGLFDRHPVIPGLRLAWWMRGPAMGAWMALVLVMVAHDDLARIGATMPAPFTSPWWLIAEGAIVGALIDLIATRLGGEGMRLAEAR